MFDTERRVQNDPGASSENFLNRAIIAILLAVCPAVAFGQTNNIKTSVKYCASVVHKLRTASPFEEEFYKNFDAFYDPVSGIVKNNAYRNGDRDPLYHFNKCMAGRGFSLTGTPLNGQNSSPRPSSVAAYLMREPVTMMDWGLKGLGDYVRDNINYLEKRRLRVEEACSNADSLVCQNQKKLSGIDRYDLQFMLISVGFSFQKERIILNIRASTNETDANELRDTISHKQCEESTSFIRKELSYARDNKQADVNMIDLIDRLFSHIGFRKTDEPNQIGSKIAKLTYIDLTIDSAWNGNYVNCISHILADAPASSNSH